MARRPGEEARFLATLLAQWMAVSSSSIQIPVEATSKADLEPVDLSHRQRERDLRQIADVPVMPLPEIVGWAMAEPPQGDPPDEPQTANRQEAVHEGLLSVVPSDSLWADSPALSWWVIPVRPPTNEALEVTSGSMDVIELPAMAYVAESSQTSIQPQSVRLRELRISTRDASEGAIGQVQADLELQNVVMEVIAQPMADGVEPILARATTPSGMPLPVAAYQPDMGSSPHGTIQWGARAGVTEPKPLPTEGLAIERPAASKWLVLPELSSSMARPITAGRSSFQADVDGRRSQFELIIESRPVTQQGAASAISWDDQYLSDQPEAGRVSPEANAPSEIIRPSNTEIRSVVGGQKAVATEARLSYRINQHEDRRVPSQGDGRHVGDKSALLSASELLVVSLDQQAIQGGKATQWEMAMEAVEASTLGRAFPAGQATAQSVNAAVTDQQTMCQAGPERQQMSEAKQVLGESASVRLPASTVTVELKAIASEELWQRMNRGRSAQDSVSPLEQTPAAEVALDLSGSSNSLAIAGRGDRGEGVSSDRAVLHLFRELVDRVYVALRRGESEWRMQLRPNHLGHLEIRLSTNVHGIALLMKAETPEALALIQANLDQLRSGLAERGIQLERCDVIASHSGAEGSSLVGHFGSWGGTASHPYEAEELRLPRRGMAWQPPTEPLAATQGVLTSRAYSLIDLQA